MSPLSPRTKPGYAVRVAVGGAVFVAPDPEPEGARIRFFTRLGGVSRPPYDSLNVSRGVGDGAGAVARNLAILRRAMEERPSAWVRQVAGDRVARVIAGGFAGEADALVTSERGLWLTVAVADCAPVALLGEGWVGMVHSGWRGTLSGICAKGARQIREPASQAYIGPCIRRCCYEVSEDLAARFAKEFGEGVVSGRNLSLPDAIRVDLERAGVGEVRDLGLCTGCRPDLFYSHRKEGPRTGRSLAAVAKLGAEEPGAETVTAVAR